MPVDTKKQMSNAKPIIPKAPIRSKTGTYPAPKLANAARTIVNPEVPRNDIAGHEEFASRVLNGGNVATPVKTFLASNVTPRSSSRKSRADSPVLTPTSTPEEKMLDRRLESAATPIENRTGPGIRNGPSEVSTRTASVASDLTGLTMARRDREIGMKNRASPDTNSSKFFHANEASTAAKKSAPTLTRTGTGFVYANGNREDSSGRPASTIGAQARSQVVSQPRFHHANDRSDTSPVLGVSAAGTSPVLSPRLPPLIVPPRQNLPRQRSTSPLKEFEVPQQQTLQKTRRMSGASILSTHSITKPAATPQSTRAAVIATHLSRKSPVVSPLDYRGHVKTQSLGSIDAQSQQVNSATQPDATLFAINSPQSVRDGISSPSLSKLQTSQPSLLTSPSSPLVSPDKAGSGVESKIDQLNAMAYKWIL